MRQDFEKKNDQPKNFIEYKEFQQMIEDQIFDRLLNNPSWHYKLEQAKREGWLGEPWARGKSGLLGYYRTSFGIQIKLLNQIDNPVPIYYPEFVDFFRSNFFKDQTLKNGFVSENLYKKEHFEIIKNNKTN